MAKIQRNDSQREVRTIAGDLTVTGRIANPGLSVAEVDIATLEVLQVKNQNEIDTLEARTITAGKGLAGGGDLSANRTLSWAPAYSASIAYAVDDIVTYSGNVYVCIQAGTNQTPAFPSTAYWLWIWTLLVTVSTSDPSGTPADGAIWIKREA